MWVMTKNGFISAVEHREQKNAVMIRARNEEHLVEFLGEGGGVDITPTADYLYRATISKRKFKKLLAAAVDGITYDNYKNAANGHRGARDYGFIEALHQTWSAFFSYQQEDPRNDTGVDEQLGVWDNDDEFSTFLDSGVYEDELEAV